MKRFHNIILVLSDDSRAAITRAVTLAKANSATLTAVRVVDDWPGARMPLLANLPPGDLKRILVNAAREQAEKALAPHLRKSGLRAECKILQGTAFVEIIRETLERKHDLVISSADHRPGLTGRMFGSTNMHLMRKCPCPVWVVKPTRKRRYTRILAAVDPSRTGPHERSLNRKLLELGSSLAARDNGEFHVVHAWKLFGENTLRAGGRIPRADLDGALRTTRANRHRQLQGLLLDAGVQPSQARVHLLKGDPDTVIPHLVHQSKIDVIVMGTVSRSGLAGLLIGNSAENILSQVDCSVLTVKPDGFVSPLKLAAGGA